jgi:hypothetical protein
MIKGHIFSKAIGASLLAVALSAGATICFGADEPATAKQNQASPNTSLYLKVQLKSPLKVSKLKPGDTVEGSLSRDVYSADRELFPSGTDVRLTVDHLEKRRRIANDHWPGVIKLFTPRHESYPVFKTATVSGASGETALQVSLISISRMREVHAQAKKKKDGKAENTSGAVETSKSGGVYGPKKLPTATMVLEAFTPANQDGSTDHAEGTSSAPDLSVLEALPAGAGFKILLLGDVSASKSKPGDIVQGRVIEPILINSRIALPAGTLVEGKVVKKTPPRWGSRAGSLYLTFTGLTLPGGNLIPISASLAGAELDQRSHTKIDAEGQLHGEHPGKAWMAINIGVTAGIAKEVDDGTQLIIEAIVSTATDASTAGTARIVATCISGIYMVSRRGRDVVLPRFTEMNIALDRPLSVTKNAESTASVPASVATAHGN